MGNPEKQSDVYRKINTAFLAIIASVAATIALIYTKPFLMPLVISLMIYTAIVPAVRFLSGKLKMPRLLAAGITFAFILVASTLLILLILNSVNSFIAGTYAYEQKISATLSWLTKISEQYGYPLNFSSFSEAMASLPVFNLIKGMGHYVFAIITNAVLCFIFLLFFFLGGESLKISDKRSFSIVLEIQNKISYYIVFKALISAATGFTIWLILYIFGVEMALIFGLLTFVLNFIPNAGSILATILPLPVMFLQYGLSPKFFILLGLLILAQFTLGNIVDPKILGEGVDLHPVFILCALVFWTLVWGIAGAFLAIPLMVALKIVLSNITPAKPLAELMAGRF
ncbi:MAG: AI-2E family transporter [Endomicrobia bacterium]|nr:AI-2E family transporter [Endomicrobiia bacterium]